MKYYEINADMLSSISVAPDEVGAVEMAPGEELEVLKGRRPYIFCAQRHCVLMVDRYTGATCTNIRQVLPVEEAQGFGQKYTRPNGAARTWAKNRKFPQVRVRGGIPPLTLTGEIAIPDFAMNGTNWFIVPELELDRLEGNHAD